jgi:hypothetical protein
VTGKFYHFGVSGVFAPAVFLLSCNWFNFDCPPLCNSRLTLCIIAGRLVMLFVVEAHIEIPPVKRAR